MDIVLATEPGHGLKNEDFVLAQPAVAIVLDGLTAPASLGTGCVHGTSWFVRKLGEFLLDIGSDLDKSLTDVLRSAIEGVASLHEERCDLTHPGTPCCSVLMLREHADALEYLVLFDSVLAVDSMTETEPVILCDDRVLQFARNEREATRAYAIGTNDHRRAVDELVATERGYRNQPGGYWVAGSDPDAALQAVTGKLKRSSVHRAALLTDGASALVDAYQLTSWSDLLDRLENLGPRKVIEDVRQAEWSDPNGMRWPRYKVSDDASVALCVITETPAMP